MESAMPTVVLVHGAWQGPWVWDEVRRYLDLARIASAAVALPSVGEGVAALAQATTVSVDSDHHPMLSRPAELALILAGIVARTALAKPVTS